MNLIEPLESKLDLRLGTLSGATGHYAKRLADLEGLYVDIAAFRLACATIGDTVVYEVDEYRPSNAAGDVIFGLTRMSPGHIGDEFYMTRGHLHYKSNRPEIYYGRGGRGVMLMESPEGEIRTAFIDQDTVCYVPPYWIHRSVNVGTDDFVMLFCYPADAGQDYGCIEAAGGMRKQVVKNGTGGWMLGDNPGWHRSAEDAAALMARGEGASQ